jgi:large subunit ribosomal protein L9
LAIEATKANLKRQEALQRSIIAKKEEEKTVAFELQTKLAELRVEIDAKGGEGGRLFGSITSADIAKAILENNGIELDKRKILLDSPIKETGEYNIEVKLYPEITGSIKVIVS